MESGLSKTVWIIDDDPIARLIVRKKLEKSGAFRILDEFEYAGKALEKLILNHQTNSQNPDLILLDLNMPIMSGWDFLEEVSKLIPSPPTSVVILTSSINPEDITRSEDYSIVKTLLHKPLDIKELESHFKSKIG